MNYLNLIRNIIGIALLVLLFQSPAIESVLFIVTVLLGVFFAVLAYFSEKEKLATQEEIAIKLEKNNAIVDEFKADLIGRLDKSFLKLENVYEQDKKVFLQLFENNHDTLVESVKENSSILKNAISVLEGNQILQMEQSKKTEIIFDEFSVKQVANNNSQLTELKSLSKNLVNGVSKLEKNQRTQLEHLNSLDSYKGLADAMLETSDNIVKATSESNRHQQVIIERQEAGLVKSDSVFNLFKEKFEGISKSISDMNKSYNSKFEAVISEISNKTEVFDDNLKESISKLLDGVETEFNKLSEDLGDKQVDFKESIDELKENLNENDSSLKELFKENNKGLIASVCEVEKIIKNQVKSQTTGFSGLIGQLNSNLAQYEKVPVLVAENNEEFKRCYTVVFDKLGSHSSSMLSILEEVSSLNDNIGKMNKEDYILLEKYMK